MGLALASRWAAAVFAASAVRSRSSGRCGIQLYRADDRHSAPLTGAVAVIGQEQLSWLQYSIAKFKKQYGLSFTLKQGDTQLSASLARTVGPEVRLRQEPARRGGRLDEPVGDLERRPLQAQLARLGLRLRDSLRPDTPASTRRSSGSSRTTSSSRRASSSSSVNTLKARNVMVIDSQDDYSTALATGIDAGSAPGASRSPAVRLEHGDRLLVDRHERVQRRAGRHLRDPDRLGGEHAVEPAA